jgi:hypothetical protein
MEKRNLNKTFKSLASLIGTAFSREVRSPFVILRGSSAMDRKLHSPVDNADIWRFQRYLPSDRDPVLVILKCHLLIEELLRALVDRRVNEPSALNDARLSFNQYRCLAKAFIAHPKFDWLWEAIKKLNSVRNALAHKLEPHEIDVRIAELIKYVMTNNPFNHVSIKELSELEQALFRMHITLSAAKSTEEKS